MFIHSAGDSATISQNKYSRKLAF